jgi:hypothetical protein
MVPFLCAVTERTLCAVTERILPRTREVFGLSSPVLRLEEGASRVPLSNAWAQ